MWGAKKIGLGDRTEVRLPGARSDSNPGPRTLGLEPRDRTRARAWGGSWDAVDVSDSRERYVCSRILLYCIVLYFPVKPFFKGPTHTRTHTHQTHKHRNAPQQELENGSPRGPPPGRGAAAARSQRRVRRDRTGGREREAHGQCPLQKNENRVRQRVPGWAHEGSGALTGRSSLRPQCAGGR